jgi:pyruvate/2-oxoglutarate dehydrogenase complex dihydrolipoamide dehydrogenase (E3) component
MTLESKSGFVRVVARRDNHVIVGWQAVGAGVSELSTAFAQSLEMGARLEDIGGTIHAHPTWVKRCRKRRCARWGMRCTFKDQIAACGSS